MKQQSIFLFGEAEKGEYHVPIRCETLPQMLDILGNPPEESRGIHCGVQSLLFGRDIFFFRVEEEGFSKKDYFLGLKWLEKRRIPCPICALCMPGVGDSEIIEVGYTVCNIYKSSLIIDESDLYDYLTSSVL